MAMRAVDRGRTAPRRLAVLLVLAALAAFVALATVLYVIVRSNAPTRDRSSQVAYGTLPITATPASGLHEGSVVQLRASGFAPNTVVTVSLCAVPGHDERVVAGDCDDERTERYAVPASGPLVVEHRLARTVDHGGEHTDCAEAGWSCRLVLVALDEDRSGSVAVGFAAPDDRADRSVPDPAPVVAVSPDRVDGPSVVAVRVEGFRPGEPLLVARCVAEGSYQQTEASKRIGDLSLYERCQPLQEGAAIDAILDADLAGIPIHADGDGSASFDLRLVAAVDPYGSLLDRSQRLDADQLADALHPRSPAARRLLAFDTEDCTAAPGRCTVVVAAAVEFERAAEAPYTITGS